MPTTRQRKERLDPRMVSVQMSVRLPFWRREQLDEEAENARVTTATLIMDALDRVYPPKPPKL